jgi:flagellar protein FlgJ
MNRSDFIATVAPHAIRARKEGSPLLPSVRIAQNILETGCNLNQYNNLGGFKVGGGTPNEFWKGKTYTTPTWEVVGGRRITTTAVWRAYDSIYDFYRDQDRLFQAIRYARVRSAKTSEEQTDALHLCGYATDPDYAKKLNAIIQSEGLKEYDAEMKKEDAEKIVAILGQAWNLDIHNAGGVPLTREEIHRLADEVRKIGGIK